MTEAFLKESMDAFGDTVYRLALCRLQNVSDAEDAFQEVFLTLYREERAECWKEEHLKAWLIRVTINKCTDIGRKRRRFSFARLEDIPERTGADPYGSVELWDAVNRLPEKIRLVFHLKYAEGYDTAQIGQMLEMAQSSVRVYLNRGRNILRKELAAYETAANV